MSTTPTQPPETGAENVRWNLQHLYPDAESLEAHLRELEEEAESFASEFRGTIQDLAASPFREALRRFEALEQKLGRAFTFAYLHWATNTEDTDRGALLQKVQEWGSRINQILLFFELEWAELEAARAEAILESLELKPYRHFLELLRLRKEHLLTEPEERILTEKAVTGRSAWNRFFDEILGSIRFRFRDEELAEQQVLAKLYDQDREVRRDAAHSLTEGLRGKLRELTFVFNTVLADKASDDRMRKFPHWLSSRNLSNEVSEETVQALVQAVTSRYGLVKRFYTLKRRLLGLDTLYDYDRYAPIGEVATRYNWEQACAVVSDAYLAFHPRFAEIVQEFLAGHWIDAAVSPGKRSGAFSHPAVPDVHPYILMNFTGSLRDVQTLAHELGHGVHQYLSRRQGLLQADTPLTTAEMASVFGEMLVFHRLADTQADPRARLSLLMGKIDDTLATVFRQVAMNRFEERIHTTRRKVGELSSQQFSDHWIETQREMFQGSVTLGEHYRIWWSYIPHFVHTPGYVYAYAFGELLVLALYTLYGREPEGFSDRYLKLLEAGGSDWPHRMLRELGVDLQDPRFWDEGLQEIEALIAQAESLADRVLVT